ncbi:MAG: OB-fold domain-containing protein [Betaproteobacteria bacterium]|nr:OB-fold domain-containing protein [Betaproteobacteria bacterium]
MPDERPIPSPNPGTAPYWKAAREHRLALPRCRDCGKFHSYPRARCPFCGSPRLAWEPCSGKGTIYSYTEVFRAPSKAFAGEVPYLVAIVALEEGPHLMTRLVTADNTSARVGQPVDVAFEDLDDEISLPVFKVTQP